MQIQYIMTKTMRRNGIRWNNCSTNICAIQYQFDPDYFLRPKIGGEGWFGPGKEATGAKPSRNQVVMCGAAMGLHAEQHFEYHLPKAGDVLTATTKPGNLGKKKVKELVN